MSLMAKIKAITFNLTDLGKYDSTKPNDNPPPPYLVKYTLPAKTKTKQKHTKIIHH